MDKRMIPKLKAMKKARHSTKVLDVAEVMNWFRKKQMIEMIMSVVIREMMNFCFILVSL